MRLLWEWQRNQVRSANGLERCVGTSEPRCLGEEPRLIGSMSREGFSEAGILNRVLEAEWEFFRVERRSGEGSWSVNKCGGVKGRPLVRLRGQCKGVRARHKHLCNKWNGVVFSSLESWKY